jgi:hypothetical protein
MKPTVFLLILAQENCRYNMATMLVERQLRWYPTDSETNAVRQRNEPMSAEWPQTSSTARDVVDKDQRKQCSRELRQSVSDEHLAVERRRHNGPGMAKPNRLSPQHHLGGLQLPVIATSLVGGLKQCTSKGAPTTDRTATAMTKTTTKVADVRGPAAKPVAGKTFEKCRVDSLSMSCPDLVRCSRHREDVIHGGGLDWPTPLSSRSPLHRNSSVVCLPSVQHQQPSRTAVQTQTMTATAKEGKQQGQLTHAANGRGNLLRVSDHQRQQQQQQQHQRYTHGKMLLMASGNKNNTNR